MDINRKASSFLNKWRESSVRKPLLLRGARQVGKSHLVRRFGSNFSNMVEVNFERNPEARKIFGGDLSPRVLIPALSAFFNAELTPGKSLLFLDEIQECPEAIKSLRYFYEESPALHVIGAGSLLEFELARTGLPVGRVEILHLQPLSFLEFLSALGETSFMDAVATHPFDQPLNSALHEKGLDLVKLYTAVGGLPEVVSAYIDERNLDRCQEIQSQLIHAYRQDMRKYVSRARIPHAEDVMNAIPRHWGEKFKYSKVRTDARAFQLAEALDLLVCAGVAHKVFHSSSNGVPLGSEIDRKRFKVLFFDVGLGQALMGLRLSSWIVEPAHAVLRQGGLVEQFVGQELAGAGPPSLPPELYYWHREARTSNAEVDYVVPIGPRLVPVEVKSGAVGAMRSLHLFLAEKPQHTLGVKVSQDNFSRHGKILSLPLYALSRLSQAAQE